MPVKLERFSEGSPDTLLSASRANQIVDVINALLGMRGENGIRVVFADGNVVIEFTGDVRPGSTATGGGGGGEGTAWTLYGEWTDIAFDANVVVTLTNADAIADGDRAGAYLSLQAVPMGTPEPGTSGAETYWKLLAPYFSDAMTYNTGNQQVDVLSDGTGNEPEILMQTDKTVGSGSKVRIRCSDLGGKEAIFREWDVCVAGVWKKALFLSTESY